MVVDWNFGDTNGDLLAGFRQRVGFWHIIWALDGPPGWFSGVLEAETMVGEAADEGE